MKLASIEAAIEVIAQGGMVIAVDDEGRENEGDVIMAAECATPEALTFMIRHCGGLVCAPMSEFIAHKLHLPPMVARNKDAMGTAFTVSVDLIEGITTGISAGDRARTLNALASIDTRPDDLSRPGHVFPLVAKPGGVLQRPGHTEAAVELAILAGRAPVGVICEIINEDGTMARRPELEKFAQAHGLLMISIFDLCTFQERNRLQKSEGGDSEIEWHTACKRSAG